MAVARCEGWGFYCAKERILQDWECTRFRDTGIRVQCVRKHVHKGEGVVLHGQWLSTPQPSSPKISTPLCELIVSSTHYDVFGILLDEFYLISLLLVWNSIFFHSLTFDGLWSIGLATFLLCLTQTSTYRQCQKTMRSKIELKYLTEGFRHILLFDNLWRNAISCDLRLA